MTLHLNTSHMLDWLEPGQTVFLHAGPSEPRAFAEALARDPARADGVTLVAVFIPGINSTDYCAIAPATAAAHNIRLARIRGVFCCGQD